MATERHALCRRVKYAAVLGHSRQSSRFFVPDGGRRMQRRWNKSGLEAD